MIIKQTILDQAEIRRDGTIQIRFAVQVVEDGVVLGNEWHRTSVAPGQDLAFTMTQVNAHLVSMGRAAVDATELTVVEQILPVVQTQEKIAQYQQSQLATQIKG